MDFHYGLTVVSILAIAVIAGGAALRLAIALGDLAAAATIGLVVVALLVATIAGARDEAWRANPYW